MAQTEPYAHRGRQYLRKAVAALDEGDLEQASEKAWGCAAEMLKAVAAKRGWRHDGHGFMFQIARRLSTESGDPQISILLHIANSLHVNFYEGWLSAEDVRANLELIGELMDRLEPQLWSVA